MPDTTAMAVTSALAQLLRPEKRADRAPPITGGDVRAAGVRRLFTVADEPIGDRGPEIRGTVEFDDDPPPSRHRLGHRICPSKPSDFAIAR